MTMSDIQRLDHQRANPRLVKLWQALAPLKSCVSLMNTGAHPDDETTPMLVALALRDGLKISHACATRGEGGQNVLGTETGKDLGVIRTREMEGAAEVLGISQYWLSETPQDSIADFGFSKSGDETLSKWGEQRTLKRFVQIIRSERPDIICPTFLDIPGQHGHHRAMTRSAFRAVDLAADPDAFADLGLPVWQAKKIYLPAWSGAGDAYDDDVPPPPATVTVDAGGADPILGADYAQIAQWSRGFHKTQGMGHWVEPGAGSVWPLHLAWVSVGEPGKERSLVQGLPAGLGDLADFANAPELSTDLGAAGKALIAAIDAFPDYPTVAKHALVALGHISAAEENCPDAAASEVLHRLEAKKRQITSVLALAIDMRSALEFSVNHVRPGDTFTASVSVFCPEYSVAVDLVLPDGWVATEWEDGKCQVTVPTDALPGNPYPDTWYPDKANAPVFVTLTWEMGDQRLEYALGPAEWLNVLPVHTVNLCSDAAVFRLSDLKPISIGLKNIQPPGAAPAVACPDGWSVNNGDNAITMLPTATVAPGIFEFPLLLDGKTATSVRDLRYDHIGTIMRPEPAVVRILVLDVTLPKGRIAYIGGGSDRVDVGLRNIGLEIDNISDAKLADLDFGKYDTILIGIFAFRTRPALSERIAALHDWVAVGGNLVTLYHRPWDNWLPEQTPPAFLKIGKPSLRWRVTDEKSEVTCLQPNHALFNRPNRIGPADWSGWQKERGLYFAAEWDDCYQPLLSMADDNEAPLTGALLSAEIGAGRHTHTSLNLHHQIDNLVPGAFRLLANLLSNSRL